MGSRSKRLEVWPLVHDERAALLGDLESLPRRSWETPSLCDGWSVWDVAAHLAGNADASFLGLVTGMVTNRFDFDRMAARDVAKYRGDAPTDVLAALRDRVRNTKTPPVDLASRLVEEVVHGEDIRRPLGIVRHYPDAAVLPALAYLLRTPDSVGGARTKAAGLRLVATDADFVHGEGREVRAPVMELLMAAAGRDPFPG